MVTISSEGQIQTTTARPELHFYILLGHPSRPDQYIIITPSLVLNGFDVMDRASKMQFRGPCQFKLNLSLLVQRALTNVYSPAAISGCPASGEMLYVRHSSLCDGLFIHIGEKRVSLLISEICCRYTEFVYISYCDCMGFCVILCSRTTEKHLVNKLSHWGKSHGSFWNI